MKTNAKLLLIFIIVILTSNSFVYADEGSFILSSERAFHIRYDEVLDSIIVGCYDDIMNTPFHVIDPETLNIEETFHLNGRVWQVNSLYLGNNMLICLGEYDGNRFTTEGKLLEIDFSTGNTIRELLYGQELVDMVIDNSENTAYIATIGCESEDYPEKILKVCLSTFQVVNEIGFGYYTSSIKLSSDGSKLYVDSLNIFPELSPRQARSGVAVFDTTDLSRIGSIVLDSAALMLEMSPDDSKLFISSSTFFRIDGSGANLYVVDTQTDEIIERLIFERDNELVGTYSMAIDAVNNKLYSTAQPSSVPTNLIIEVDLDDYTYSFFEMGDEPLHRIALAQTSNGPRMFAIEKHTPFVHYKDLWE